jgi:negative regulator of sigma E activity
MKEEEALKDFGTRQTGMKVPDGYFADFASRMDMLIDAEEALEPKAGAEEQGGQKVSLWTMVKPWLYMAAMFASFAVLFRVLIVNEEATQARLMAAQTEEEAIVDDMIYGAVSDYDLFEYMYANAD